MSSPLLDSEEWRHYVWHEMDLAAVDVLLVFEAVHKWPVEGSIVCFVEGGWHVYDYNHGLGQGSLADGHSP